MTPTIPHSNPLALVSRWGGSAFARSSIALSFCRMTDDNSTRRVTQRLRELATQCSPGTRLPSVRELQQRHRVSPVTVKHAMAPLIAEGLIEALAGHGTFVRPRPDTASAG